MIGSRGRIGWGPEEERSGIGEVEERTAEEGRRRGKGEGRERK